VGRSGRIERGRIELGRLEPGRLEGGRIERISRSSDISSVFRSGRFRRTRGLKLGYASNDLGHHRVAFAPTRSLRRAVDRNRQKRISREAYRQLFGDIAGSYDLVFVIYGDASTTTRDRRTDMVTVLDAAGLLERPKR
jgi:ribonuclease P protein component